MRTFKGMPDSLFIDGYNTWFWKYKDDSRLVSFCLETDSDGIYWCDPENSRFNNKITIVLHTECSGKLTLNILRHLEDYYEEV